jgi:uncharacterized surface protein with fasciclin (FAS1) repeats
MRKLFFSVLLLLSASMAFTGETLAASADTATRPVPSKELTITDYFVSVAPQYQTFLRALNESSINATIQGEGPFTIFAPTNAAFTDLPYGNINELIKPENKDSLQKIITYHIVAGAYTLEQLRLNIKKNGGRYIIQTIGEGGALTFYLKGNEVYVKDKEGYTAPLSEPVVCENGLVYSVPKILTPGE